MRRLAKHHRLIQERNKALLNDQRISARPVIQLALRRQPSLAPKHYSEEPTH